MTITDYPNSTTTSNGYINVTAVKKRFIGFFAKWEKDKG